MSVETLPPLRPSPDLGPAPGSGPFDYALSVSKVAAITFPFIGPGVALLDLISAPLRGRRMDSWCEELRLKLNDLSRIVNALTPEQLAQNEAFISAFEMATQAALRTHQTDKLNALRNAVLNVAAGTTISEDLQTLFLNLVDGFTPKHLQTLSYLVERDGTLRNELLKHSDLVDQAVTDLNSRGMIKDTRAYAARGRDTSDPLINSQWDITPMGEQFLAFIKSPPGL